MRAGGAVVEIAADDSKLGAGLRKAADRVRAWGEAIGKVGGKVQGLGADVAAIAAGPLGLLTLAFKDLASLADTGALSGEQAEQAKALDDALTDLVSAVRALGLQIATLLAPALVEMVGWVTEAVDWVAALAEKNPGLIKTLAGVAFGFAAVGAALMVVGQVAGAVQTILSVLGLVLAGVGLLFKAVAVGASLLWGALTAVAGAIHFVASGAAFNAVALIAAKVAAVALTVATYAASAAGLVFKAVMWLVSVATTAASGGINLLVVGLLALAAVLAVVVLAVGGLVLAVGAVVAAGAKLSELWDRFKEALGGVLGPIREVIDGLRQWGVAVFNAFRVGDLELAWKIAWGGIKLVWDEGIDYLLSAWDGFRLDLLHVLGGLAVAAAEVFASLFSRIVSMLLRVVAATAPLWDKVFGEGTAGRMAGALAAANANLQGLARQLPGELARREQAELAAAGERAAARQGDILKQRNELQKLMDRANAAAAKGVDRHRARFAELRHAVTGTFSAEAAAGLGTDVTIPRQQLQRLASIDEGVRRLNDRAQPLVFS